MPISRLLESVRAAFRRFLGNSDGSFSAASPKLLPCPNTKELRAIQTIGPDGGMLQLGDHRLVVPRGAVSQPVSFSGVLLVDRFLKVQLRANNGDTFKFNTPASLKLSYGHCQAPADPQRLRIYKIDPDTNRILEDMGGKVDERERSVTTELRTLSSYTIGSP